MRRSFIIPLVAAIFFMGSTAYSDRGSACPNRTCGGSYGGVFLGVPVEACSDYWVSGHPHRCVANERPVPVRNIFRVCRPLNVLDAVIRFDSVLMVDGAPAFSVLEEGGRHKSVCIKASGNAVGAERYAVIAVESQNLSQNSGIYMPNAAAMIPPVLNSPFKASDPSLCADCVNAPIPNNVFPSFHLQTSCLLMPKPLYQNNMEVSN